MPPSGRRRPLNISLAHVLKKHTPRVDAISSSDVCRRGKRIKSGRSCLEPSLSEVLKDDSMLPYLIQYLQSCGQAQLVYFWLATETFRLCEDWVDDEKCILESVKNKEDEDLIDVQNSGNPFSAASSNSTNDFGEFSYSADRDTVKTLCGFQDSRESLQGSDPREVLKQSAINVFTRYLSADAAQSVPIPDELRRSTLDRICSDIPASSWFVPVQDFVYALILNNHFSKFLSSTAFLTYQLDRITATSSLNLHDILFCPAALSHFTEYLEVEKVSNSLVTFYLAALNFKSMTSSGDSQVDERLADGSVIFDRFFAASSLSVLPFDKDVVRYIERGLLRSEGVLPTLFDVASEAAERVLEFEILPHFLTSKQFYRFKREVDLAFYACERSREGKLEVCVHTEKTAKSTDPLIEKHMKWDFFAKQCQKQNIF